MHRSKLTVQIAVSPENREALDALRNRSRVIPTLFFLDNCVVSHIKLALDRGTPVARSFVDVDLPHNGMSYLPTLMEKASNVDKPFTEEELIGEVRKDLGALRTFFAHATVYEPEDFAIQYARDHRGIHPETLGPEYHELLTFASSSRLYDPIADRNRLTVARAICAKASELGIGRQHPLVLALLGCIFGCIPAQKVMKFKRDQESFNASGALADIQLVQRIGRLSQVVNEPNSKYVRTDFLTDDKNLEKLYRLFFVNEVASHGSGDKVTMTVETRGLFPSLFGPDGSAKDEASLHDLIGIHALIGLGSAPAAGAPPSV